MAQRVFQATILLETNGDSEPTMDDVKKMLEEGNVEDCKVTLNYMDSVLHPLIYFKEIKNG